MLQSVFRWTDDSRAEAAEMWSDGRSLRDIANHMGVSRSVVSGYMNRNRDIFPRRKPTTKPTVHKAPRIRSDFQWDDAKIETARMMWAEGETTFAIAEEVGCSRPTVSALASRNRDLFPERQRARRNGAPRAAPVDLESLFPNSKGAMSDFTRYRLAGQKPIAFVDVQNRQCRFPVSNDEGPEMLCCGADVTAGSYCAAHSALAWRPRT